MNTDYLLTPCLVAISIQSCQLQRRNSMGNTLQLSCAEDFVTYLNEQLVPGEGIPIKISENNLRLRLFVQELEKEQKYNKELEAENEALHGELHMLSDQIENLEKIVSQKDQQSQHLKPLRSCHRSVTQCANSAAKKMMLSNLPVFMIS